jgi:hypothetical protein
MRTNIAIVVVAPTAFLGIAMDVLEFRGRWERAGMFPHYLPRANAPGAEYRKGVRGRGDYASARSSGCGKVLIAMRHADDRRHLLHTRASIGR